MHTLASIRTHTHIAPPPKFMYVVGIPQFHATVYKIKAIRCATKFLAYSCLQRKSFICESELFSEFKVENSLFKITMTKLFSIYRIMSFFKSVCYNLIFHAHSCYIVFTSVYDSCYFSG